MTDLAIEGFTDREYAVHELTDAINVVPNSFGLVTQLGIFPPPRPLSTTFFRLDRQNWSLNLLPFTERGGPGSKGATGKRDSLIFEIPQVTHEDALKVSDVQNLRAFGSMAPKMLDEAVNEKLVTLANKFYITHEWHRLSMLQGVLLDADGSEVLNLFTTFGITRPVSAFGLGGSTISQKLRNIKRYIELNLKGEVMTGVAAIASRQFMEMLFADAAILAAYNQALGAHQMFLAMNPTIADRRFAFTVQEITFMEYNGSFSNLNTDGTFTSRQAVPDGDAIFYPTGTQSTARQFCAPGDFEEAVNMPGQLMYVKERRDEWGRSREFLGQSNLLPFWNRPQLLVRGTTGAVGDTINA